MPTTQHLPARARILDTATRLFYREGYQAVGIDRIIAEAGVAKATFYRHFPSKDDLILAYLEESDRATNEWLEEAVAGVDDPVAKIIGMMDAVSERATHPECHGCAFQATAAEFSDHRHPGHQAAISHKTSIRSRFEELGHQAGLRMPDLLADQLLLLMDGAWAAARVFGPVNHATSLGDATRAIIAAHLRV